jgi:hypothetical protein
MRAAVVHGMISPSDGERFINHDSPVIRKASLCEAFAKSGLVGTCSVRQLALQAHASLNKVCRPSITRVPQSCLRWCFHLACGPLAAACNPGETRQTFRPFPLSLSGIPVRNISNILQLLHFPSSSDRQYKSRHIVFQFATVRHFLCGAYLTSRFKRGNRSSRIGLTLREIRIDKLMHRSLPRIL